MSGLLAQLSPQVLTQLIRISVFLGVTLMVLGLISVLAPRVRRRNLLVERIGRAVLAPVETFERPGENPWTRLVKPFGQFLMPRKVSELSSIRAKLGYAGYRKQNAVVTFYGLKAIMVAAAPLSYFLLSLLLPMPFPNPVLVIPIVMLLGYFLPDIVLARLIRRRQFAIFRTLPDIMDLMVVCIESGLGIDVTLKRVGEEIGGVSPVLAHEFGTLSLELQTGVPRAQALQNLTDRNGESGLRSLVRVLSQADRFGTSVAQALRVHSESMTTKRIQMVEEMAGKATVKLVFPLILCILPALWIVLVGPALIRLFAALKGVSH